MSDWWAQELTVEFERHIGRRILGQTADAGFQLGVSRTFYIGPEALWDYIVSREGFELITGQLEDGTWQACVKDLAAASGTSVAGIEFAVTTFMPESHYRMRWKKKEWDSHSILQLWLTDKSTPENDKTSLTIHHEKLPDADAREKMKGYWKGQVVILFK